MDLRRTRAHEAHVARQKRGRSIERKKRAAARPSTSPSLGPSLRPSPSPSLGPSPSHRPCAPGKVRNPASGRCVKRDSRALLFSGYYNGGVPLDFLDCAAGKVYSVRSGRCVLASRAAKGTRAAEGSRPTRAEGSRPTRAPPPKPLDPMRKDFAIRQAQRLLDSKNTLSPSNVAFIDGAMRGRSPSPGQSAAEVALAREVFASASPERQRMMLAAAIELMESGRTLSPEQATFVANMSLLFR
jgi:hypothetical protein